MRGPCISKPDCEATPGFLFKLYNHRWYCVRCDPSCYKCGGEENDKCSECPVGKRFTLISALSNLGTCTDFCGSGLFFSDGITRKSCDPCHSTCKECTDSSSKSCTSCDTNLPEPMYHQVSRNGT